MSSLTDLSMTDALAGLSQKKFSAVELAQSHIAAVEKARDLNAFLTETPELAIKQAKASDDRRSKGLSQAMDGIPLAIKDLFCTKDIRTTAASRMLENFIPKYESTVTEKLLNAGCVVLGKTNLDEFAMGSSNGSSYFGPVISPWSGKADAERKLVPGGSSGGSAAAVAARIAMGATGTDTGGSIRQPAAFTGIVGLKPTYGRCSRFGIVAYASSLDQAGPMTRTIADAALMMQIMAGFDAKDSTSVDTPVPDYTSLLGGSVKGLKIGIPKEYRADGMPAEIDALWQTGRKILQEAGAEIVEISLPHTSYSLAVYYIIAPAEASSNLARYDGVRYGLRVPGNNLIEMYENTRGAGFGTEVRRRILMGTYVLSAGYYDAYYIKAQKVRRRIRTDFNDAFKRCDAILTPTAPSAAFAIGENEDDPIKMYLNDVFTVPVNLAGLPAVSVPVGLSQDGLPLGLQLIGKPFDEGGLMKIGQILEKGSNINNKPAFCK